MKRIGAGPALPGTLPRSHTRPSSNLLPWMAALHAAPSFQHPALAGRDEAGERSEPAKKMVAEYFDANFSVKYLEAARELFPSLRNGTLSQVQLAACRDD